MGTPQKVFLLLLLLLLFFKWATQFILEQNRSGYKTNTSAMKHEKKGQRLSWGRLVKEAGLEILLEGE